MFQVIFKLCLFEGDDEELDDFVRLALGAKNRLELYKCIN
jgi:hypothetical protein